MLLSHAPRAGIALALAGVSVSHAALLSTESFAGYTLGQIQNTSPSPTIAGYSGNWTGVDFGSARPSISSGSLTYSNPLYLGSSGDKVGVLNNTSGGEIASTNSGRVERVLDGTLAATASTTGSLYLSFLFQSGQETGATVYQTLSLNAGTGDPNRNFDLGLTTNGSQPGTSYSFGVDNSYTSTGVSANTAVHLFVVKFNFSAVAAGDSVTVWVDPVLGLGDSGSVGITATGKDITFDRLTLSDYDGNSAAWDEVRWGTSFDSVTAIPEPSTYAVLLGLVALGVVGARRRAARA